MKNRFTLTIVALAIIISISCSNQKLAHELKMLSGSTIKIPNELSAKIGCRDTLLEVNQHEPATMIIWYDTVQCASCSMNSINIWNKIFEYSHDSVEGFNPVIIFSPNKRMIRNFEEAIKTTRFKYPLFVDYNNTFGHINPQIPMTNNLLHVFLLDKNNKVVLVGSPLYNESLMQLYKSTINKLIANGGVLPEEKGEKM
ncbi:MAG TPA: hypothetical protein VFC94_06885 [Bacteroidaceae bacterium]|nr:hypothetical protein [Bacteroidaceae bacterium]